MSCKGAGRFGPGFVGDPVDTLTGAVFDRKLEFRLTGPLEFWWYRHYNSGESQRRFALGWGHTHEFDRVLHNRGSRFTYESPVGVALNFLPPAGDGAESIGNGYVLRRVSSRRFQLFHHGEPSMEFEFQPSSPSARLRRLFEGTAEIVFEYSGSWRWERVIDSARRVILVDEGPDGLLHSLRFDDTAETVGRVLMAYEYDSAGNLVASRNMRGHGHRFAYDVMNRVVRVIGRKGFEFRYTYDELGRCVEAAGDDRLYGVTLTYKVPGRQTHVRRADGGVWVYSFDDKGSLIQILNPLGGEQKFVHDASGRVAFELDPNKNLTRIEYDRAGAATARIGPRNRRVELPEDPNAPDPLSRRVALNPAEYAYGRLANPCRIRMPDAAELSTLSLPPDIGRLVSVRPAHEPSARGPQFPVRPLGKLWWPEPRSGQRFDEFGKLVQQHDEWGRTRSWRYDGAGNLAEQTDFDGGKWLHDYGTWHLIRALTNPMGARVDFTYTTNAKVASFTDAGGATTEYHYDRADQLVEVHRHGVVREIYTRDAAGAMLAKHAGDGSLLVQLAVGPGNVPVGRTLGSGDEHTFTYDDRGRDLVLTTGKDRVEFAYDLLQERTLDVRNGLGIEHRYHSRSRPAESVYFARFRVRYEQTPGRTAVIDPAGGVHEVRFPRTGLASRRFSSGSYELEQYDNLGRCLFKYAHLGRGAGRIWKRRYEWSGEGELRRVDDSLLGEVQHEYDVAHRLRRRRIAGRVEAFEFDIANNLLAQPGLSEVRLRQGNRLASVDGHEVSYDARNHLSVRRTAAGETRYTYDSRDQLVRVESPDGIWEADYDALGRRTRKRWRGQTTEYYWNSEQLAGEIHADGRVRLYVYADPLATTPLLILDYDSLDADADSCRRYFVFSDQVGAPVLIEQSNGVEVWRGRMSPFGQVTIDPTSTIECHFRMPGHYHDEEIGLHYNRSRHYDPTLGRYLQSDPWGIAGGFNLYAYSCNPLLVADVRGLGEGGQDETEQSKQNPNQNGDEKPPPSAAPHADDDSKPPLMSKEDGEKLARAKNAEYRAELDAKIAAGDMSKKDAGPVAATVVDRRTGEAFSAHNDRHGNPPDPMHPLVEAKVKEAQANPQHPSDPGSHAEVHALNEAVTKRDEHNKANGLPPATQSDLDEFTQVSEWRKGSGDNTMKPGDDAPRCGNCQTCTDGVDNRSGDAPKWPPPYDD